MLLLVVPLLALLALAPKQTWTQNLKDGSPVTVVAVSNFAQKKSWGPDGAAQKTWVVPDMIRNLSTPGKSKDKSIQRVIYFEIKIKPHATNDVPSVAFRIGDRTLNSGYTLMDVHNNAIWYSAASVDSRKLPTTINLKVGVGTGSWKSAGTHDLQAGAQTGYKFFGSILRRPPVRLGNPAMVLVEASVPSAVKGKLAYQIKLYGLDGKALAPAGIAPGKANGPLRYFFVDNGQRIIKAELLTRPYSWLTFKGIHTKSK
jgi:hypothetical protein